MIIFPLQIHAMKNLYLLLWLAVCSASLQAQGVFSTKTTAALQKVIQDYPHRFKNIKGDRLAEHTSTVDYKSRVEIAGATNTIITQHTKPKDQYSWSCELSGSANFEQARTSFQDIYNQISNTIIKIEGEKPFILNGRYEVPTGERKLTVVRFELLSAPAAIQPLKIELVLRHTTEWKVMLVVYDQQRDYDIAIN